jgi:hypothetical protein
VGDLWRAPLRWAQVAWHTYQVSWRLEQAFKRYLGGGINMQTHREGGDLTCLLFSSPPKKTGGSNELLDSSLKGFWLWSGSLLFEARKRYWYFCSYHHAQNESKAVVFNLGYAKASFGICKIEKNKLFRDN